MSRSRELALFFVLAYVWSWLIFIPLVVLHGPIQWTIVATLGPTVAALVTQRISRGSFRAFRLITSWWRTCVALILGVILVLFAYVFFPAVATADPRKLKWSILLSLGVYHYSSLLGGPLGEEPGWRGYALPRLEASFGPIIGSILLAALWATWHIPLFFYPGWTTSTFWIFLLMLAGLSFIFTLSANLSHFNIIPAIAIHVAFNTVSAFLNGLFTYVQPKTRLPFELIMALSGIASATGLVLVTKGQLAFQSSAPLADTP